MINSRHLIEFEANPDRKLTLTLFLINTLTLILTLILINSDPLA